MRTLWGMFFCGLYILLSWVALDAAGLKAAIDFPPGDSSFSRLSPFALIVGCARVEGAINEPFDMAIVHDRSASTSGPSGADIDGDGIIGKTVQIPKLFRFVRCFRDYRCTYLDDSILVAEVVGTLNLVRQLKPCNSRVIVLGFSEKPLPYNNRGQLAFPAVVVGPL